MESRRRKLAKSLHVVGAIAISALWSGPALLQAQRVSPQPATASESADENRGKLLVACGADRQA